MHEFSEDWKSWIKENGSRLMLFARQQSRSEADAEDVLQMALIKTWKTHQGPPDKKVLSLAYANVRRCAIDLGRSVAARESGELVSWFELPEDDTSRALQVALAKIPEKFREVITLKIWGEQTFEQIGRALRISPNTAASRYRYGMDSLRRSLVLEKEEIGLM